MSPITVFFAAEGELPHATANTAEITKSANSFPNVRFISMPLLASFHLIPPLLFRCFGERLWHSAFGSSGRAVPPYTRHLPFASSVRPNCCRGPGGLGPFEVAIADDAPLDEGVLCPWDELEQWRRF